MVTPYTEDCISLTGVFGEPVGFPMFRDPLDPSLRLHELGSGMKPGEMIKDLHGPGNYLYLQRDLGVKLYFQGFAFVPPDETLQSMSEIYRKNRQCLCEDRARVKVNVATLEYKFVAAPVFGVVKPVFLRHPITGKIIKHEYPYPAFPTIRLRTAEPILVVTKACCQLPRYPRRFDPLEQLEHEQNQFFHNPPLMWFSRANWHLMPKSPLIPSPPSVLALYLPASNCVVRPVTSTTKLAAAASLRLRKRQRDTAPSEECPPPKRPRGTPCIHLRRNPPRAAKTMAREIMAPPARRRRVT
ncbi:hypothetical protein CYLTODRAFT_177977 [Cylindrobasidium torrendii FP15055 ss-10]|uniref:Uncharacterized protein n=1 Tax=Cylindrobasidium torrendii FP15055 ss-10 TaxID=1314674 RepID=A0A0D7AYQ8_9AGAR|nr:hypothetical protein CYLTODRAFT_177977 [Cylindrobasidium torrendii FP15055 ss-10]